jgi:general secretion pathway protein L
MASKILGIDLGSYSVKVVVATAGLRQVTVHDVFEVLVPPGDAPLEQRAGSALALLVQQRGLHNEVPHFTYPGDAISVRIMDFAFSGVKRADLERAVGSELEQLLPHDLEEIVYDFDVLPRDAGGGSDASMMSRLPTATLPDGQVPPPDADPVAPPGTRVIAVATTKAAVKQHLELGLVHQLEPRSLVAAPMSMGRVIERAGLMAGGPLLIVDVGHRRTNVSVTHRTRTLFARSLSRGSLNISQAIAKAWDLTPEQAERAKHTEGFIASALQPAASSAWQRISDVIVHEVAPLARELRQTVGACRAATGVVPKRVLLCGGGGRLRGLASFLQQELDLPVQTLSDASATALIGGEMVGRGTLVDAALPAIGAVLEAATGRPAFDLRKGEFTYRVDFSFLRRRAPALAAMALVLIAFVAASAYASLYRLRKEQDKLDARLEQTSTQVLGAPATAEEVVERIELETTRESPLPKATAFDILVDLSKRVPPKDKGKVELGELDIKKDKISIRATAESATAIDELETALKEIKCFENIQRGRVQSGTADEKQFTLTITNKCM